MKAILVAATCLLAAKAEAQSFTLSGTVQGRDTSRIVFEYYNSEGKQRFDTGQLRSGAFRFTGNVNGLSEGYLTLDANNRAFFMVEPGNVTANLIPGHFDAAEVQGGSAQTALNALEPHRGWANGPETDKVYSFGHTDAMLSAFLLQFRLSRNELTLDSAELAFGRLSPAVRGSRYGILLEELMEKMKSVAVGKPAPLFEKTDINGKLVRLSDFRGRYVLLDFWASWCVPCRQMTPRIRDIYRQYHPKGLEVISIAWDWKPELWKEAVAKDSLQEWHNLLGYDEQKGFLLRDAYSIPNIPVWILIDPGGTIAGRFNNADDEPALEKALTKIR